MNGDTAAVPDRSSPASTAGAADQIQQGTPAFRRTAAALFLASDDARFCTAHNYWVDAGWR